MRNVVPFTTYNDHQELLCTIGISGVYSITLALWLIFGRKQYLPLYMLIVLLLNIVWLLLRQNNCLPLGTEFNLVFYVLGYVYHAISNEFFDGMMLTMAVICVIGDLTCISFLIVLEWIKDSSDQTIMVSNRMSKVILNNLIVFTLNGGVICCYLFAKQVDHVWKILCFVVLGGVGLMTIICIALRLVSPCQEYWWSYRSRVLVRPIYEA
ncbi:hypothetical protein HanXRQr2_Chr12g0560351 [Helianthus annuus]|uniref:Uncharacterized protein n=1 Tax=Helianthus annuus TaxID=4232 RepID=A0A9K3HJJ3_HELAN|nr:hypothetical protein HanXRQr2_Chr12g0560351 [Helianthus annuus]KAJ0490771.1 hypothetical protein HanHA300_Chr12g0459381 [Helianthus annuus]KAJ0676358.1 hypothetical protein HanLR1_Chr12g0461851 [Helianthus annuus]